MSSTSYSWNEFKARTGLYRVDRFCGAQVAISEEHWVVHEGFAFLFTHFIDNLANAGEAELLLKVPANTYPHIHQLDLAAGRGDVRIEIFEGPTTSSDGTPVSAPNQNRNSTNTPGLNVFHTPTVSADGTKFWDHWLHPTASGSGGRQEGLVLSPMGTELVLKPETNYLIKITNNSGATIDLMLRGLFYELPEHL